MTSFRLFQSKTVAFITTFALLGAILFIQPTKTEAAFAIASTNSGNCNQCASASITVSITPSGSNRGVIIATSGSQGGVALSVNSVTVDGNNATVAADSGGTSGIGSTAEVWYYVNPTASTQNVVVTYNNLFAVNGSATVTVYAVTGMKQTSPVDNSDTVSGDGGSSIGTNLQMAIAAGAEAVVAYNDFNVTANYNGTSGWSEDTSTANADSQKQSAGHHLSAGATENPYANNAAYNQVSAAMASFLAAPEVPSGAVMMMGMGM